MEIKLAYFKAELNKGMVLSLGGSLNITKTKTKGVNLLLNVNNLTRYCLVSYAGARAGVAQCSPTARMGVATGSIA